MVSLMPNNDPENMVEVFLSMYSEWFPLKYQLASIKLKDTEQDIHGIMYGLRMVGSVTKESGSYLVQLYQRYDE